MGSDENKERFEIDGRQIAADMSFERGCTCEVEGQRRETGIETGRCSWQDQVDRPGKIFVKHSLHLLHQLPEVAARADLGAEGDILLEDQDMLVSAVAAAASSVPGKVGPDHQKPTVG